MAIEFTCLHCGCRLSAEDSSTGERIPCDECGAVVKVPNPIGGKLTDRRLRESPEPDRKQSRRKQARADADAHASRSNRAEPLPEPEGPESYVAEPEPAFGFLWQVKLDRLINRKLKKPAAATSQGIVTDLEEHFAQFPERFRSGSFILRVERYEMSDEGYDANFRLLGTINGDPFSKSVWHAYNRFQQTHSINPLAQAFSWAAVFLTRKSFSGVQDRAAHKKIRRLIQRQLCDALDEACGKTPGFWEKFIRFFTRPMG